MKSKQGPTDQEQAERAQLDNALSETRPNPNAANRGASRPMLPPSDGSRHGPGPGPVPGQGPSGGPNQGPRLVRALPDRRERGGMNFYDEYVQTAQAEPYTDPRRPNLDGLSPASFGPRDHHREMNGREMPRGNGMRGGVQGSIQGEAWSPGEVPPGGRRADGHGNGYGQRVNGAGYAAQPPANGGGVPAVVKVNDSVFSLLSEQVKDLRQQKRELQAIIAEQEEKITDLIALVHEMSAGRHDISDDGPEATVMPSCDKQGDAL